MLRSLRLAAYLAPALTAAAADPAAPAVSVLPLTIPGYQLKVLDVRKTVVFQVHGSPVEVAVPIFLYSPDGRPDEAVHLIRRAREGLAALEHKPEWTAEELSRIVADLDAGLGRLAGPAPGS